MERTDENDYSFEEEVMVHRAPLMRAAMKLVENQGEAEDLVQETLLRAFRSFDRFCPQSRTRAWLLTILRNTFITEWRRRKRERSALQLGLNDDQSSWIFPEGHELEEHSEGDLSDEVIRALEQVPQNYRDCVILVDLHDKSYKEAATLTRQPLGTIQSRLFRGRRILRDLLQDYAERQGILEQAA